ncbi:MAG: pyridoxine 5'-phosphate synthase [Phycisphaerales bacterium]
MPLLGVNIDHVATLRQARYRGQEAGIAPGEPDPVRAAHEAELGGAEIITVHLREDRRHINDRDLRRLREAIHARLNLEMAATDEMVGIARALSPVPQMCTLVPEGRQEVTTEGGLDVASQVERLGGVVSRLHDAGIVVSAFIDAQARQVDAAQAAGFDACEIHTGPFASAFARAGGDSASAVLAKAVAQVGDAGHRIRAGGMRFNAGHALSYLNVRTIAGLPGVAELHIGHAIVSRAVFTGLRDAVREMKRLMESA